MDSVRYLILHIHHTIRNLLDRLKEQIEIFPHSVQVLDCRKSTLILVVWEPVQIIYHCGPDTDISRSFQKKMSGILNISTTLTNGSDNI